MIIYPVLSFYIFLILFGYPPQVPFQKSWLDTTGSSWFGEESPPKWGNSVEPEDLWIVFSKTLKTPRWDQVGSNNVKTALFLNVVSCENNILNSKGLHCRLLGQWNRRRKGVPLEPMVIGHDSPRFHGFGDARPWVNRLKVGLFLRVAIVYEGERWVNMKQQNWLLRAAKGW